MLIKNYEPVLEAPTEAILFRKSQINEKTFESLKTYMEDRFPVSLFFMPDVVVNMPNEGKMKTNITWYKIIGNRSCTIARYRDQAEGFLAGCADRRGVEDRRQKHDRRQSDRRREN